MIAPGRKSAATARSDVGSEAKFPGRVAESLVLVARRENTLPSDKVIIQCSPVYRQQRSNGAGCSSCAALTPASRIVHCARARPASERYAPDRAVAVFGHE